MAKWIGIIFVVAIIYMIITDNMGGSKKATTNYNKVMTTGGK